MTKREFYNAVKALENVTDEMIAHCDHEIELLDKKATQKSSKPSPRQAENEALKPIILATLTDEGQTVSQIVDSMNSNAEVLDISKGVKMTVPRVTALLRQISRDEVKNEMVKGKSYYSLA